MLFALLQCSIQLHSKIMAFHCVKSASFHPVSLVVRGVSRRQNAPVTGWKMSRPRNKYSVHQIFSLSDSDRISAAHSYILPRLYPLRTRHPSPEVAPIALARISPTMNFRLPATYLEFTIIMWVCFSAAGGHFSPQCAVTGFLNFTFTYSGKRTFHPMTLNFSLWPWNMNVV